ncbi:MAG: AEC family transporter [Proteobacteria bacterium]|nr:AEC family transporter [Pseudomonadota bacterium]
MNSALSALVPVFGMIVIGYLLKARGLLAEAFWEPAERLTFYFLFPALLVTTIGGTETAGLRAIPMAAAMITATLLMAGALMATATRFGKSGIGGPGFSALLQGAIRPNTYVGLAAAYGLFGNTGLTLAAAAIIAVIPLVNFISIIALLRWPEPQAKPAGTAPNLSGWGAALVASLKNPIIIACLLGIILNFVGLGLPPVIGPMLEIIGRAALPMGLMAVGAGLDFEAINKRRGNVALATALKLVAMPVLTYAACLVFDVTGVTRSVAVMFGALPVAAGSYIMTRQMGGDGTLMAGIVTATILGAAVTLPLVIMLTG